MESRFLAQRFAASMELPPLTRMTLRTNPSSLQMLKHGSSSCHGANYLIKSSSPQGLHQFQNTRSTVLCMINMASEESDEPRRLSLDSTMDEVRKVWESFPPPVKSFPWIEAFYNFLQLILELVLAVTKYLSVPLLAISSLSEISYSALEGKLVYILIPLLLGLAVGGVLKDTALELSPSLKDRDFPWHLATAVIFFTFLKLPGPYYPYWGRILIPHFSNGVLLRTLWPTIRWRNRVRRTSETVLPQNSVNDKQSERS